MKKILMFIAISFLTISSFATPINYNGDYEDVLLDIYNYLYTNKDKVISYVNNNDGNPNKDLKKINEQNLIMVNKIRDFTKKNKLILKSIAYQPDWKRKTKCNDEICDAQMRVTWADKDDNMIVKTVYNLNTDKNFNSLYTKDDDWDEAPKQLDFVLHNSFYADKRSIDNIKIMYRKNTKEEYAYFEIDNTQDNPSIYKNKNMPTFVFKDLAYKHCEGCHSLIPDLNHKSTHGAFFPRFQYDESKVYSDLSKKLSEQKPHIPKLVFLGNPEDMSKTSSQFTYLPKMSDSFIHYVINVDKNYKLLNAKLISENKEYNDYSLLFSNPDILQDVVLREQKNYCVSIKFEDSQTINYICADIKTRQIYSKMKRFKGEHYQVDNSRKGSNY